MHQFYFEATCPHPSPHPVILLSKLFTRHHISCRQHVSCFPNRFPVDAPHVRSFIEINDVTDDEGEAEEEDGEDDEEDGSDCD